ncbi:MAG TPA: divalent-cation tolerance protein CutA [Woeseiaceae bacterium]|nr:divalent-cation tolerance protein CutA [Woeseiaceae bacterium]
MDAQGRLIMTTVDSEPAAATLATALVERRLAACVQQIRIASRYRWDGQVQCDDEILLLVKTSAAAADAAMQAIKDDHPYEVPEIIALPISDGLPAYLDWLAKETAPADTIE